MKMSCIGQDFNIGAFLVIEGGFMLMLLMLNIVYCVISTEIN